MTGRHETPDVLEAAVRAELLAEDMRAATRAAGPAPAEAMPAAQCVCDGVQCDEDKCDHCRALDPDLPCPSDGAHPLTAASFGAMVGPALDYDAAMRAYDSARAEYVNGPSQSEAPAPQDFPPAAARAAAGTANLPVPAPVPVVESVPVAPAPAVAPFTGEASARPYTWAARHDPASFADYHVRDRLTGKAPLRDLLLPLPPALDQGADGDCVGFGCTDAARILDLIRVPAAAELPGPADAVALYTAARKIDGEAATDPAGTSVLAGMKAGQADGYWGGYLWADGTSAIAQAMLQLHVPVVIGVPWHEAMETPGPGGVLTVAGGITGGHCVVVCGIKLRGPNGEPGPWFRILNSWGPAWGVDGCGWIFHRSLAALLHDEGEAAIPTVGTA